jgi:hypothetical protein
MACDGVHVCLNAAWQESSFSMLLHPPSAQLKEAVDGCDEKYALAGMQPRIGDPSSLASMQC